MNKKGTDLAVLFLRYTLSSCGNDFLVAEVIVSAAAGQRFCVTDCVQSRLMLVFIFLRVFSIVAIFCTVVQ